MRPPFEFGQHPHIFTGDHYFLPYQKWSIKVVLIDIVAISKKLS